VDVDLAWRESGNDRGSFDCGVDRGTGDPGNDQGQEERPVLLRVRMRQLRDAGEMSFGDGREVGSAAVRCSDAAASSRTTYHSGQYMNSCTAPRSFRRSSFPVEAGFDGFPE